MISSQHARPAAALACAAPPSAARRHHDQWRRARCSYPETDATTLNACACVRSTCAVSTAFAPSRAQSARKDASSLATCSTGGPNGRRKLSALLGQNPGSAPRVATTIARCRFCRRASPSAPASAAFGASSAKAMGASLPRTPSGPSMPAESVKPPSKSGSPSILRPLTTRDASIGIDAAEREFLEHRLEADLAHLAGEPLAGYSVDCGPGAVESLIFVSANDRANALPHALTPP